MGFMEAVRSCFGKYVTFSGRAPRSEYWYFVLFLILGGVVASTIDVMMFPSLLTTSSADGTYSAAVNAGPVSGLFSLLTLLPGISVSVRRLHDLGRSGWWVWLGLIPLIGWIVLLVWYVTEGTKTTNQYGPDPLAS